MTARFAAWDRQQISWAGRADYMDMRAWTAGRVDKVRQQMLGGWGRLGDWVGGLGRIR